MNSKRRYIPRKSRKPRSRPPVKPGSDKSLKKIFASIGVPKKKPFMPDRFQSEAVEAIKKADCLVTAPTGAGKTWIAVEAIRQVFNAGGRAWYASPLKALTNAKYQEFSEIFGGGNLGILTGDRKENTDAPILVGTTEILRNQLYDAMHRGENISTDLVVLDEAHYLGDYDRGVVWEETMIYLPSRIPLLMLSATIGNARQIADWLESIRARKCITIEEKNRPVPLFPLFLHPSGTLFPLLNQTDKKKQLHRKASGFVKEGKDQRRSFRGQAPPVPDLLRILNKYDLLPAIFFLKSRADCDNALTAGAAFSSSEDETRRKNRKKRIAELVAKVPHIAGHKQMQILKQKGLGAHHSGQLPAWKIIIETLMTEGYLDAVFATSTVAAGVNFPARSIVFFNSDRFNGREFSPLTPTEFHQMTGRAGRRGMDKIGFALAVPGRYMDISYVARLVHARATDVISQIQINFSMTLNLLLSHHPEQIRDLLDKSFATYQFKQAGKNEKTSGGRYQETEFLWQNFLHHLDFLKKKAYVSEDDTLTDDGIWASQLRIDHPLMVAEGFRANLFPESDPALLAAVMASLVNERETDDAGIPPEKIPDDLQEAFATVNEGLMPFSRELEDAGFEAPVLYMRPALTLYNWANGGDWEDVLALWDSAEGDLAMLIMRTADNLRHIGNLAGVFPAAANSAKQAIDGILRDPVVSAIAPETNDHTDL
ncbi:MAG: DEAD/DEAH box helicase [Desulfosalsimonadaceae bacterium]